MFTIPAARLTEHQPPHPARTTIRSVPRGRRGRKRLFGHGYVVVKEWKTRPEMLAAMEGQRLRAPDTPPRKEWPREYLDRQRELQSAKRAASIPAIFASRPKLAAAYLARHP